ncbi:hypothetical protein GH714_005373 [Hevea brasiliensis]|uniref:Uncharacterized protein n=1 Tax=Hevea brasiliensis TaxID=3981 RepID=A0A6A6M7Z4_HEVBR|nr:hypothetical protein GH714_005373 [Hevea brasiliensis]
MGNSSHSGFENRKFSVEEISVGMSSSGATEQIVEALMLDESALEEKLEEISSIARNTNEPGLQNADQDDNSEGVISDFSCSHSQIVDVFGTFPSKKFDQECVSDERNVALAGFGISEESGSNGTQSFIYCEKSENSLVGLDGSKEQAEETLCLTSGGPGDVNFCAETLHVTTELLPEDTVTEQAEEIELETVFTKSCDNYPQLTNPSPPSVCGCDVVNFEVPLAVPKSHAQMITVDPILDLTEADSKSISSISNFTISVCQFENGRNIAYQIARDELRPSLKSVSGLEQLHGDCDLEKAVSVPVSENSEEEQFIFSDLDDFKHRETRENLNFSDVVVEENNPSFSTEGTNEVNKPLSRNDKSFSSQDSFFQKNQLADVETLMENSKGASSPISIPNLHNTAHMKVGWLAESLPNMWSCSDNMGTEDLHRPLSHSLDSGSKPLEWKLQNKDESCCINSDTGEESQSSPELSNRKDSHNPEDIKKCCQSCCW